MILVPIDMPESCDSCYFWAGFNEARPFRCHLTNEEADPYEEDRPENCPLIETHNEELNGETGLFTLERGGMITTRLFNILHRNGILSLSVVQNKTVSEIRSIKGLGPRLFKELSTLMNNYGLDFKEEK